MWVCGCLFVCLFVFVLSSLMANGLISSMDFASVSPYSFVMAASGINTYNKGADIGSTKTLFMD